MGNPNESTLYDRKVMRTVATGSTLGALAGAAAVVLAILGLADIEPHYMLAIAAIVVGAALLAQAGFVAAEASTIAGTEQLGRTGKAEFEGGISAEALAGGAAIVLGILALLGIDPRVLMSVTAIVLGTGLILETGATTRLNSLNVAGDEHAVARRVSRRAVAGSEGAQVLVGLAAIVLGILALVGFSPMVLNLVALLAIGAAILLGGAALGGRAVSLRTSH